MAQDLFNFDAKFNPTPIISAKDMILTASVDGQNVIDYLVQNVSIGYQRPVQLIRQLSNGNIFYVALPPQGTIGIARIVGSTPISSILGAPGTGIWTAPNINTDGVTTAKERTVELKPTNQKKGPKYTMRGCVVSSYSASTDANGTVVSENVSINFGSMEVSSV